MHRCPPYTLKNEKDTQYFGEVSPWDAGKVPKVLVHGNRQRAPEK